MTAGLVVAVLVVLLIGLPLALLAQRLRVSVLVAYLLTGVLVGPQLLGLVDARQLEPVAGIGASLLLFALGLELDLAGLRRRLRAVAIGASLQIVLTIAAGTLVCMLAGLGWRPGLAVAACLTMTSTLVLLRAFEERRIGHREESKLAVAMSLAQDIAVGPLLLLFSLILPTGHERPWWTVLAGLVGAALATWLLRRFMATGLMARIRAAQLPELEVAFAVLVALGAAALAEVVGIGAAAGAFCAGLALGSDQHRSVVETSVRPLQGLMAILFFVAMGVLFDPAFVAERPLQVAAGVMVTVLVKAPVAALALRAAGLPWRTAVGYGLVLSQVGEFSFVLAAAAFSQGTGPALDIYRLVVAVTAISLAGTPLLVLAAQRFLPRSRLESLGTPGDTIVVAGLGPVGNTVVEALIDLGQPLLLVDRNPKLLAAWSQTPGVRCHQGRIEEMEEWLPVLGHRPSAVILTFPIPDASALVAERLRRLAPDLPIIARSPFEAQVDLLHKAGAQYVICDEREAAAALLPILQRVVSGRLPVPD